MKIRDLQLIYNWCYRIKTRIVSVNYVKGDFPARLLSYLGHLSPVWTIMNYLNPWILGNMYRKPFLGGPACNLPPVLLSYLQKSQEFQSSFPATNEINIWVIAAIPHVQLSNHLKLLIWGWVNPPMNHHCQNAWNIIVTYCNSQNGTKRQVKNTWWTS